MLKSLRSQLIFSHILPSLVIIPLMGILLVYFLERQIILPGLENQLADDAAVIASLARLEPQIFSDPALASTLLDSLRLKTFTRVMLIDRDGKLLASTEEDNRLGQLLTDAEIDQARSGVFVKNVDYSQRLQGEIIDIYAPVIGENGQVLGIFRISYRYASFVEQLMGMRYIIVLILTAGIFASALLGLLLALNLNRPIQEVTQAIFDLARGARADKLPEQGPDELKRLQQAANYLVSRLLEMQASRRQMLSNLVHELGRPLGGVRMSIQVLRDGAKEDPQVLDELLEGMDSETALLGRVVDDLSHLHDLVIGNLELDLKIITLSEWLPTILISQGATALQKGVNWSVNIPPDLPDINIDPQRMAQAIGNLVNNAIKYTSKGDSVTVAAGMKDASVWIRVHDSGPGIPLEEQARIFEPFYRGTQKQRIKQGMGLGLSIARDVVQAHQGRLEMKSDPGLGSEFTIWLPVVKELTDMIQLAERREEQGG
jgi:two-component system sensor histidine kinase BaeS